MADSEKPTGTTLKMWIDWNGAAQKVSVGHTNQVVVQTVEHEVNLTFFMFSQPVVLASNPEEVAQQLQGAESLMPDCLARINMSARTAKGLIEALQKQFDEKGRLRGDEDENGS